MTSCNLRPNDRFGDYWSPFLGSRGPAPVFAMSLGEISRERIRDRRPIRSDGSIHTDRASVGRARPRAPLTMADVAGRWNWVSIAAAILLACYLGVAIWALAAPSQYDPQQGMAIGFIIPVALVLGGLLFEVVMLPRASELRDQNPATSSMIETRLREAERNGAQPKR